jgi:predicted amidohydrolase YtcJ
MDPERPVAKALAAVGQKIVYVGDDLAAAEALLPKSPEIIDLKGQAVVPGLIDSHAHVTHEGLRLGQLDLYGLSFEATLAAVAQATAALPPGAWLHGRGWDQNLWPGQAWPDKKSLDQASPNNPVALDRVDKHSVWANSLALAAADLRVLGPDPEGGEIVRGPDGSPNGVLIGQAMFYVLSVMPPLDGRDLKETMLLAQREMLGHGLTTVVDAATRPEELAVLARGYPTGEFKIRYRAYAHQNGWARLGELARADGLCEGHLAIDGLKLFSDGSLGSRSAWLLEDYADRPGHRGSRSLSDEALASYLALARDKSLQVAIHVIGDAAVAQAVAAVAKVLGPGRTDRRWRLEHFQVVADADLDRVLAMGLIPSIQSVGLMTDLTMAADRLGPGRLKRAYAWRGVLDRGGYLVNGSDCPVEPVNPFLGIYAAVTRQNLAGQPPGGFLPAHRLTRFEALASYTVWGARAAFQEGRLGVLAPGAMADFAVLDRDLMACPDEEIPKIKVLLTVVGGKTAFGGL